MLILLLLKIICSTPTGQGLSQIVTVVTTNKLVSSAYLFSYGAPILSSVSPSSGDTAGGFLLTLSGTDFGVSGIVNFGSGICSIQSYSSSKITCLVPPGQGLGTLVTVSVSGQTSNSQQFSYLAPMLYSVTPTNGVSS